MNERDKEIANYEREFWSLIKKNFDCRLESMSISASPYVNGHISFNAKFPTKNIYLINTPYLYTLSKKIIHFTSISALYSIINDGAVRLYNLNNSNDDKEYSYASEKLSEIYQIQNISKDSVSNYINQIKEWSFILSCTDYKGLYNLDFWKEYGDNGKGIAIEFEIINEVSEWEFFYCSEIFYNKLESFDKLISGWKEIQNKYNHINYHIRLNQLLSLHKSDVWSKEAEIRILTNYPDLHSVPFNERVFQDFKAKKPNLKIKYFSLPLCDKYGKFVDKRLEDRNESYWGLIPRIRIADIHYGPDFHIKEKFWEFHSDLRRYIFKKLKCSLPRNTKNRISLL